MYNIYEKENVKQIVTKYNITLNKLLLLLTCILKVLFIVSQYSSSVPS